MEKLHYVSSYFESSDTVTHQGNWQSIQKFLNDGYSVQVERNGYWVLIKYSRAWVIFSNDRGEKFRFDMRSDILSYYCLQKLYKSRFDRFVTDLARGKINVYLDGANNNRVIA